MSNLPDHMKAAVMTDIKRIKLEDRHVPVLEEDEILVKVRAVGVCGSDVHYFEHGRIGDTTVDKPIILGHECAGDVVQIGSNVKNINVGERVAIEPGVACGRCEKCKEGRYNLCPNVVFYATPPVDGAFSEYVKIREDFAFVLPDSLSYEEGALIEPFSVGIHAANRTALTPGSSVAILGMGPVGLMAIIAAKAYGASQIFVSDLEPKRLEIAKQLGATHTLNPIEEDVVKKIYELTDGTGVDAAWETAGNEKTLQTGLQSVKRGGKLAVIGLPPQTDVTINIHTVTGGEIDIIGIFRYANTYPKGIDILASGEYDVTPLITEHFGLENTQDALEQAMNNKKDCVKMMVYPHGN